MVIKEEMEEESWDVRETFAYFGNAFYMASVFEVGLAHALLFCDFLSKVSREYREAKGVGFDRAKYEAEFDAFMDDQFAQTLGNLIKRVSALAIFDDELKAKIIAAKTRRDFLAHHYWRERSREFATFEGRERMRDELMQDSDNFGALDRQINAALVSHRKSLGIKDEWLENHFRKMMQELRENDRREKRPKAPLENI
jgi:hypothetical protein